MTQRVRLDESRGFLNNPGHVYNLEIPKIRNGVRSAYPRSVGLNC